MDFNNGKSELASEENIQKAFDEGRKHGFMAMAFYKGTACPLIIYNEKHMNDIINMSHKMIKNGLIYGHSLEEQIVDYINQLSYMEKLLCEEHKKGNDKQPLDEEMLPIYWMNVIALLKLKVLKNDDMNGLQVMRF